MRGAPVSARRRTGATPPPLLIDRVDAGEGDEGPGASASSTPTPGGFTNHVFRSVLDPRVRAFGPRIRDLPSKRLYLGGHADSTRR